MTSLPNRDRVLGTFALLFAILAVSNFAKPFPVSSQTGFVLFGRRLSGASNAVAGAAFGVYLLTYAQAIWRRRRYALPMGWVYAVYVVLNLVLYNVRNPPPPSLAYHVFGIVYSTIAIGVSSGAAYALTRLRAELR